MKYIIDGPPTPLLRARHVQYRVYDSQKQQRIYQEIEVQRQIKHEPYKGQPLRLDVIFYMHIPISRSRKKRMELLGTAHMIRPDESNLLKWVEDVCTGAGVYHDDCAIAYGRQVKVYDLKARTEFRVTPISNEEFLKITQELKEYINSPEK